MWWSIASTAFSIGILKICIAAIKTSSDVRGRLWDSLCSHPCARSEMAIQEPGHLSPATVAKCIKYGVDLLGSFIEGYVSSKQTLGKEADFWGMTRGALEFAHVRFATCPEEVNLYEHFELLMRHPVIEAGVRLREIAVVDGDAFGQIEQLERGLTETFGVWQGCQWLTTIIPPIGWIIIVPLCMQIVSAISVWVKDRWIYRFCSCTGRGASRAALE
jgi:hypothetical protein